MPAIAPADRVVRLLVTMTGGTVDDPWKGEVLAPEPGRDGGGDRVGGSVTGEGAIVAERLVDVDTTGGGSEVVDDVVEELDVVLTVLLVDVDVVSVDDEDDDVVEDDVCGQPCWLFDRDTKQLLDLRRLECLPKSSVTRWAEEAAVHQVEGAVVHRV